MAILNKFRNKKIELILSGLIDTILIFKEFDFSDSNEKIVLFDYSKNTFFNIDKNSIISTLDENKSASIQLSNATIKLLMV